MPPLNIDTRKSIRTGTSPSAIITPLKYINSLQSARELGKRSADFDDVSKDYAELERQYRDAISSLEVMRKEL